jgi:hypothetical protein
LSFFDEADEPQTARRTASRTTPSRSRGSGSGRRPPSDRQSIQVRRGIAAVGLLIVVVLIALGVHSCQVSARNSSLKDYANNVSSLVQQSDQTSTRFFGVLSSGASSSNATNLQNQINETRVSADNQLSRARGINVPSEVKGAQQNLVTALQLRSDGIGNVASEIQPALGTSTSEDAVTAIAANMARFYASDVLYKDYTATQIAGALNAAHIAVGGADGVTINPGQFLPDVQWVNPSFVASQLHVTLPTSGANSGKVAPGLHGHVLNSVSVGGTTLQTGSTNAIPASPPATFTLNFTNGGQNTETNVVCKVTVSGTSDGGQTIVPQTTAGQKVTAQVTLKSAPPKGTYTVVATVEPVAGEKNTSNNSLSFPVTFQ